MRRISVWAAGVLMFFGAVAAGGLPLRAADCEGPPTCNGLLDPSCLAGLRVGAGSVPTVGLIGCRPQIAAYRACLQAAARCDAGLEPPEGHSLLGKRQTRSAQYLLIQAPAPISWSDARTAAEGLGGQLASIGSQEENDEILALLESSPGAFQTQEVFMTTAHVGPWIGGYQQEGAAEPSGGWRWLDGAALQFANWRRGEPNDLMDEDYLVIYCRERPVCADWSDANGLSFQVRGYLVEIAR